MENVVRDMVVDVLDRALPYVKEKNSVELKELSNKTVASGSISQDEESISVAVIIYALSKIIERCKFRQPRNWENFYQHILDSLSSASKNLKKNDFKEYKKSISNLFTTINQLDNKLSLYIQEVIEKAKIKKGSMIYEHGISLSRVSELLGISNWELMNYVGNSQIIDAEKNIRRVVDRLNYTRKIFGLK